MPAEVAGERDPRSRGTVAVSSLDASEQTVLPPLCWRKPLRSLLNCQPCRRLGQGLAMEWHCWIDWNGDRHVRDEHTRGSKPGELSCRHLLRDPWGQTLCSVRRCRCRAIKSFHQLSKTVGEPDSRPITRTYGYTELLEYHRHCIAPVDHQFAPVLVGHVRALVPVPSVGSCKQQQPSG